MKATIKQVAEMLETDQSYISKYKGIFRYHQSYFYRFDMDPGKLAKRVKSKIPWARIIDTGDHWHAFVGGAKSGTSRDSYMYVKFEI